MRPSPRPEPPRPAPVDEFGAPRSKERKEWFEKKLETIDDDLTRIHNEFQRQIDALEDEVKAARISERGALRERIRALKQERNVAKARVFEAPNPSQVENKYRRLSSRSYSESAQREWARKIDSGTDVVARMVDASVMPNGLSVRTRVSQTRAHYDLNGSIFMRPHEPTSTVVHELGHAIEDKYPEVLRKSIAFRERRTVGEKSVRLRDLTGKNYQASEITKPDKFTEPYTGKLYQKRNWQTNATDDYASEILSMGLQYLYEDAQQFRRLDPDFFRFVLETIWGVS